MSDPSAITGLPLPQVATQAVGNPGHASLHREPVLLEDAREIARRFVFLKRQLAEAEHRIHHLLDLLRHGVHGFGGRGLHRRHAGRVGGGGAAGGCCGLLRQREHGHGGDSRNRDEAGMSGHGREFTIGAAVTFVSEAR